MVAMETSNSSRWVTSSRLALSESCWSWLHLPLVGAIGGRDQFRGYFPG